MRPRILFGIIASVLLIGCKPFVKIPPIPLNPVSPDQELKYIFKTDQKDRRRVLLKVMFQSEEKYSKNDKVIAVGKRDSIRLVRVVNLDENKSINSDEAKFHAGFIYLHEGGGKVLDYSLCLKRSSKLFEDVIQSTSNKKLKKRAEIYFHEAQDRIKWESENK